MDFGGSLDAVEEICQLIESADMRTDESRTAFAEEVTRRFQVCIVVLGYMSKHATSSVAVATMLAEPFDTDGRFERLMRLLPTLLEERAEERRERA